MYIWLILIDFCCTIKLLILYLQFYGSINEIDVCNVISDGLQCAIYGMLYSLHSKKHDADCLP
jgi:hypothetical protein